MSIKIAPSLLAADLGAITKEIQAVEQAGADYLHLDVMDGSFVPPITFGDNMLRVAKKTSSLHCDVHLMVQRPESHVDSFINAGADTLTIHLEACQHIHRTLQTIREGGVRAGIAINPGTPIELLDDILEVVDLVLIMTVNPGWGGQTFIPSCLSKVSSLATKKTARNLTFDIEVDGGITNQTGAECVQAGATVLVAGSYIYGSNSYSNAISSLR